MNNATSQPASIGLQAMLTKSTSEQETLKAQLASAEQDVVRIQEELAALQPRYTEIARLRQSRQAALAQAREQVDQARAKARLAVDTAAEGVTIQKVRVAEEALANQQEVAEAEEIRLLQESEALAAREQELVTLAEQREADRQRLHEQSHVLRATHGQVQTELGEALYGEQIAALTIVEQRVADLADQLVDARVELSKAREQVRATLSPWPHLLKQVQIEHTLVDDHLSRLLSTYLAYMETLLSDGPAITFTYLEDQPFHRLIAVSEHQVNGLVGRSGASLKPVKEHIEMVRSLLQQYQRNHQ